MQQLRKKYGYKFYDCTMEEWKHNFFEDYEIRKNRTAQEKPLFEFVKFQSVKQGIELIKNVFIPAEHEFLPLIKWTLHEKNTLLLKELVFKNEEDAKLYQTAIERAWALFGHLDIRVKQIYYD